MLGTNVELGDVVTIITFCVVVFVVCVDGLVKVIFTGDMWGGKELAMLCIMLLILGLPLTGTVIVFETGTTAFGTSFRTTGEELEEFVRLRFLGFSSSSEQLTLLTYTVLPLGKTTTLEAGLAGLGDLTVAMLPLGTGVEVGVDVVLV